MKDYKLSEIKKICEEHYEEGDCNDCPIFKFCYEHIREVPYYDWEIDEEEEEQ